MHTDHTPTAQPFSADELARLRRQDRQAGGVVAGLMTIIFLVGLVLYAAIAYVCVP